MLCLEKGGVVFVFFGGERGSEEVESFFSLRDGFFLFVLCVLFAPFDSKMAPSFASLSSSTV